MLLPSDVARLVLGYLQQEGLTATSRAFIFESPNLKEYAEHSSEDGVIPACVFSLFGKNLITILNEYVAVKAKETSQENQIPVVMTSLWKKLDFTLNQIKSMQNSPAVQQNQRLRTRNSIQNMRRQQRPYVVVQSPLSGHLPITATGHCVPSPVMTPQGMLAHSTPVSYTSQHARPSTLCLTQPGESPLQILVPDNRLNPGPLSPARRKCDSPRRRGGGQIGSSATSRSTVVSSTLIVETQSEEAVTENLSQIVIENAREKILNDRSLQEKLAENINKILASDNSPQTSKAACSTLEQEQSIDEILGLQGEIHMTDDAIQDILAQTESDPAFQALFDLFDYGKSKMAEEGEQADGSFSTSTQETDEPGHVDSASDIGTGQEDSTSGGESSAIKVRTTSETKSKKKSATRDVSKSPAPTGIKQTSAGRGSTRTKRGPVRTRVLPSNKQTRSSTSTLKLDSKTDSHPPEQTVCSSSVSEEGADMEVDETPNETSMTLNAQNPQLESEETPLTNKNTSDEISSQQVSVPGEPQQPSSVAEASVSGSKSIKEIGGLTGTTGGHSGQNVVNIAGVSTIQSDVVPSLHLSQPDVDISTKTVPQHSSNNKTSLTPSCTQQTDSTHKHTQPSHIGNTVSAVNSQASLPPATTTTTPSAPPCVSDTQAKEPDPSKIMSLKIIISDEQDEHAGDVALNQAVSSISGEQIPTIFLSSPAKSPAKTLPATTPVITQEETAQAVCSLQGVEGVGAFGSPTISVQSHAQTTLARPVGQETGFIQLLPANPTFGASGSYFVVTDSTATEQRSNVVLLPSNVPQGTLSSTSHVVATPPRQRAVVSMGPNVSQTYSPGSTIIISSPVQPMLQNVMVPVSVMGQNTGKLTVLPNQMLTLPCSAAVKPLAAKVISQPKLAPKESADTGKTGTSGSSQVTKVLAQTSQTSDQQKNVTGTSPSHRRILCFDVTSDNTLAGQSSVQTSTLTSTVPSPTQQAQKENTQSEPNQPLVSDSTKTKRRIETIRLPEVNHSAAKEQSTIPQQQKEPMKTSVSKKEADQTIKSSSSSNKAATDAESHIRSEPQKKSPSEKDDGGVVSQDAAKSIKSSVQGHKQKSGGVTKDNTQEESHERRLPKPAEQSSEKVSLQDSPGITANKENELEGCQRDQRQANARPAEDLASPTSKPATPVSSSSNKTLCKTSPLTKQAVEMLQDIQSQTPVATPSKRQGNVCPDLPLPRTPGLLRPQEEPTDGLRTPSRQRLRREGEGTPKFLPSAATPEIPSCSPASEAGSENSINMAAHTLMILSRAARTGGPLKDSLRQEEASAGKSSSSKGKKRKHIEPSPPAKKELQLSGSSGSKKKSKKQKKLLDSFPDDLDVDKFLSSLHYDE